MAVSSCLVAVLLLVLLVVVVAAAEEDRVDMGNIVLSVPWGDVDCAQWRKRGVMSSKDEREAGYAGNIILKWGRKWVKVEN
jgi:hypothetical protein